MQHEPIWPANAIRPSGPEGPESTQFAWKKLGACRDRDPEKFFVQGRGNLGAIQSAKKFCKDRCPVIDYCREYALEENIVHGVWGGLSSHQRSQIRSKRRKERRREKNS